MKTERILGLMALIGLILKLLHINGGDVILIITLSTLAFVYFPGAFYFFSDKDIKNQNIPFSVLSGLLLSSLPVGVMFALMYWPGSKPMLGLGLLGAIGSVGFSLFMKNKNEQFRTYYTTMFRRSLVWSLLAIALYFLPLSTQINIQHWDDKKWAEFKYRSYSHPENEAYKEELKAYVEQKRGHK